MAVHPSVPAKTIPEFIAYAKANPGRINVESPGAALKPCSRRVVQGDDWCRLVHVPYRGNGPALTDLLAGQVQLGFDTLPSSIEYIRAGKLRALAVSTLARSQALPDLPSVSEFVPGYESSGFFGVGAPAKTPGEIVDKLNKEINAGLADAKLKARTRRTRRHDACRLACGLREAHRRRNREMGQVDPRRQHQGG